MQPLTSDIVELIKLPETESNLARFDAMLRSVRRGSLGNSVIQWCLQLGRYEYLVKLVDHGTPLHPSLVQFGYREQSYACVRLLCEHLDLPYLGSGAVEERIERLVAQFATHCADQTIDLGYLEELVGQGASREEACEIIPRQEWNGSGGAWGYAAALARAVAELTEAEKSKLGPLEEFVESHFQPFRRRWIALIEDQTS